jgi:hypothetical protein
MVEVSVVVKVVGLVEVEPKVPLVADQESNS